jgi:hypothetical protein
MTDHRVAWSVMRECRRKHDPHYVAALRAQDHSNTKPAVVAPMPSAGEKLAVNVNPGFSMSCRTGKRVLN